MAKSPTPESVKAGVTHATARHMLVKGLIERDAADFVLTAHGRAVLAALLAKGGRR